MGGGGGGGAEEGGSGPGLKKLHLKKKVLESPEMARFAIKKNCCRRVWSLKNLKS